LNAIGASALFVAFLVSLYGTGISLAGSVTGRRTLIRSGEFSVIINFLLLSISSAVLLQAFLSRDFSLLYVFEYSSRSLSSAYTVTAFWAGQEGSLLLWAWLLAAFTGLAVLRNRHAAPDLTPWATFVLMLNSSFFLFLLNFVSDPFTLFPGPSPADGYGLNPLLQNPGMIIHPPTLFIGYVGFTIPFAFALASLLADRSDSLWIVRTRLWVVVSWLFLGVGILLGAEWAYVELGWGGYWAWDPVENASLMPWLTATALLHSMMVQERRGLFKFWNVGLIIFTYFLVILGTFITRSGIVSSVHAFGKGSLGNFFLVFMVITLFLSLAVVLYRRKLLTPSGNLSSLLSRESAFLLGNLIFSVMAFSVFWGTTFPVISELLTGTKIMVGQSFYNRVNVPIALLLMVLIGTCPLLAWRRTPSGNFIRNLLLPLALAAAGAAGAVALGINEIPTVLVMSFSVFILGSVIMELSRDAKVWIGVWGDPFPLAAMRAVWENRSRYGGYVVHLGMVIIFLGLSGAPLTEELQSTIKPRESLAIGNYTLKYRKMEWIPSQDRLAVTTQLLAFKDGKAVGLLIPEKRFYEGRETQSTSEVSILSDWKEDLYVALTDYSLDGQANFRVLIKPFVSWLWIGGYVVGIGTLIAIWPRRRSSSLKDGEA
jgi:cytochrome c-type biogenesis protein CcmF